MNTDPHDTEILLGYLCGDLSPDTVREVERRLIDDNALRRQLLELSTEEVALTDWAKSESVSARLDENASKKDEVPPARFPTPRPNYPRPLLGLLAAAAMVVAGLTAVVWLQQPRNAPSPGVALLLASTDANWNKIDPEPGAALTAGKYQLTSGLVDLLFSDGARVSLGGPAAFELKSTRHLHQISGRIVARISDEALGFVVTSPRSEVIDLGTEFGLSVDETGRTDVHVLDGLVEVLSRERTNTQGSVTIGEGQARRFGNTPETTSNEIPVASRETLLGRSQPDTLGLQMLRGSVRISRELSASDLTKRATGSNWIDLIAERRDVTLDAPLAVSIDSTGSYRNFEKLEKIVRPGTRLDSHLLHFRPGSLDQVRGVIRFDQPIVAILCTGSHLDHSDALFGIPSVAYPKGTNPFRGLEPNGHPTALNSQEINPDWQPDEIVLSQDGHTISIGAFANTERGYDQVRILTKARQ